MLPPSRLLCTQLGKEAAFSEGPAHCWLKICSIKAKKSQGLHLLICCQPVDEAEHKHFASLKPWSHHSWRWSWGRSLSKANPPPPASSGTGSNIEFQNEQEREKPALNCEWVGGNASAGWITAPFLHGLAQGKPQSSHQSTWVMLGPSQLLQP